MIGDIPFLPADEAGLEELAGASPAVHNVIVDAKGAVRRRPGIEQYTTEAFNADGDPIELIHRTFDGDIYVVQAPEATPNKPVWKLGGPDAAASDLGTMNSNGRVLATETQGMLALAGGREPYRVELATGALALLGGSPPRATHVIGNASRLLLNDTDEPSQVRYSGVQIGTLITNHEVWEALSVFTAEARPDRVVAIGENTNEVWVWGETSTQVFAPDPTFVYSPVSATEHGCSAPHGIVKRDQAFYWLDHRRRFVVSAGRGAEVISGPIQRVLDELSRVDDCFGYWVHLGPADCLVWTFPSDGVSLVFQRGSWSRWTGWNQTLDRWERLSVNAYHQRTDDNVSLVGTLDGRIGKLSLSAQTDLGTPIKAHIRTGYLDRGTNRTKHCAHLKLELKRGHTTSEDAPVLYVGWRDQPGEWTRLEVDLGTPGDTDPVVLLDSLGTYRRRQWYFEFAGIEELVLVKATEEFEILGY